MAKSKQKTIVVPERPATIDCYPVAGHYVDLTKCTLFVKVDGMYCAIPEAMAT